ncbi:fibronectin type III domain-containing protein [Paenibacillus wenxiniae]
METAIDVPSKPANVKVKSSTMHTIDLVWDKSNSASAIKEYVIYQDGVEIGRTSTLTYSIKNLRSGTTYNYSVQSVNDAGKQSEQSEIVPVTLDSDIPTTPASLTMGKPVDGTATVTWNTSTSQGAIQKYIVRVNGEVVTETVETKYSLQSITKDKSYTISVTAVTEEGISSSPAVLILPAAPIHLSATNVDMYTKNLSWEIPDSQKSSIKMYKVYLNNALYKSISDTSVELEQLVPGKVYKVQVTAISNTDTESSLSDALEVSTIASPLHKKFIFALNGNAAWSRENGDLWVWGANIEGNLGDGTKIVKTNAIPINIKNVKQLSNGGGSGRGLYTLAVTENGKLWGWGTSFDNAIGDLSPYTGTPKLVTLHGKSVDSVLSVTSVQAMNYILKTDGTVWRFGAPSGDLYQVDGLTSVIQIVGEYALKSDGTVWKYTGSSIVQLKGISDVKEITYGYGLKTDGTVWKWTSKSDSNDIVVNQVPGLSQIIRVEAGSGHIVALKQNGTVWTFGSNMWGQLGYGTIDDSKMPTQRTMPEEVKGLRNVVDVSASGSSTFAVQADGTAWGWGFNYEGRLGDGTTIDRAAPVKVVENTPPTVQLLEMGERAQSPKTTTNPKVTFKWEQKDTAVDTVFSDLQVQVLDEKGQKILDSGEVQQDKLQITTGNASWISTQDLPRNMKLQVQVRVKDGTIWSEWSQPGWFSILPEPSAPTVFSLNREMGWLKADGSVWMWGKNDTGQLGDGTNITQLNAIPIDIQNVKQIFNGGTYTLALKTDGSVWGWGTAYDSSLGVIQSGIKTPVPVVLGNTPLKDIQQIGYMDSSNYVLKNDGTLWYFGRFSDLRQVPDLKFITQFIRGYAVKSDGTVWRFDNSYAKDLPELTDVQQITSSYVLKKDGTVWSWYYDQFTKKTTVKQITGLSDIAQLQDGMALKKDGSVWTWGQGYNGQLGDGTTNYRETPAQVKGLNQVVSISSDGLSLIALQADGTAWSWGLNDQGQLGDGTKTTRLTPVRVLENIPPVVKVLELGESAEHSVQIANPRGDFKWEQKDNMPNTLFSDMQIQVLDEKGEKIQDSGELKQDKTQMASATGSWLTHQDLPENVKLQVQIRVKDGSMWSDWSLPGWFIVKSEMTTTSAPRVFNLNRTIGWIKNDGSLWMWGDNTYGELGDGTNNSRLDAIPVNVNDIKQLVNGDQYIVALKNDGTVWGWGTSQWKMLSDVSVDKQVPKPITFGGQAVKNVKQISLSSVPYILKDDGTVWYFSGRSASGLSQISDINDVSQIYQNYSVKSNGTVWISSSGYSKKLPELTNVLQLTGNYLLKKDGTVWKWAYNESTEKTTISQVTGLSQIVQVQTGMALKKDGTVWTWGINGAGQLGDGTNTSRENPAQVQGLDQVTSIASNGYSLIALQADGTAWTWGSNAQGQLGDGTKINRSTPVKVIDNTPPTAKLLELGASAQNPLVLGNSRFTFNWEQKDNMPNTVFTDMQIQVLDEQGTQILDSGELKQDRAQSFTGIGNWIGSQEFSENIKYQVRVRVKDGSAWSEWSQPGWFIVKLEVDSSSAPSPAVFSLDFKMGWVKADGTVWMWGQNESGQLGNGTTTNQSQAVRTYIRNVKQLAGGDKYTLALKTDGSLWGWGTTSDASLGEGLANKKMPGRIIIGGQPLKNIQQIVSLSGVNYILKNDGTVWYFGPNSDLRQVPNLTSISQLSRIAALKNDGTVWQYDTTSAKIVSELTNVQQLMSSTILKKDGTVWRWWYNDSTKKFNVTQVSGLTQVTQIQNGMAVKKDGSLWTWGDNVYGQLADGTQKYREAAAQVKGISKVVSISNNERSVVALQADGTAWSWAENTYGQLGDGTTTNRLVPVKVITAK